LQTPLPPSPSSDKALPIYNLPVLISMKVRMEGFIALDYASRYPEARTYLADQLQRGNLQYEYTIFKPESKDRSGLGRCTEALEIMFKGENIGKT
jgi:NADPH-dependent curcumin reductase CurA